MCQQAREVFGSLIEEEERKVISKIFEDGKEVVGKNRIKKAFLKFYSVI